VSTWGAFDMLGNLEELVSNWNEPGEACWNADSEFGEAEQCFGGDPLGKSIPHGMARGGSYLAGKQAAIFAIRDRMLEQQARETGFRCARDVSSVLRK
jgi:formylglycine-generating enzyme required for sulfatase activity